VLSTAARSFLAVLGSETSQPAKHSTRVPPGFSRARSSKIAVANRGTSFAQDHPEWCVANCPEGPVWNQRISRAAASSNFGDSYHIDPVLSIIRCYYGNHTSAQTRRSPNSIRCMHPTPACYRSWCPCQYGNLLMTHYRRFLSQGAGAGQLDPGRSRATCGGVSHDPG